MTRTPETTYRLWYDLPYVAGGGRCDDLTLNALRRQMQTMVTDYGWPTNARTRTDIDGNHVACCTFTEGGINEQRLSVRHLTIDDILPNMWTRAYA
jgi:hypothetical protein